MIQDVEIPSLLVPYCYLQEMLDSLEERNLLDTFCEIKRLFPFELRDEVFRNIKYYCLIRPHIVSTLCSLANLLIDHYQEGFATKKLFKFDENDISYKHGTIEYYVKFDQVDELIKATAAGQQCSHAVKIAIRDGRAGGMILSLVDFAAYSAAIKCFKFLLLNGAKLGRDSATFAIMGGNMEIVHLCKQKSVIFGKNEAYSAISYHRNDVYDWIILNYDPQQISVFKAIEAENYKALIVSLQSDDKNAAAALKMAASHGSLPIAEYIMDKCPDVDLSNPLKEAINCQKINIIKSILKKLKSPKGLYHMSLAVKSCNLEIVKLLIEAKFDVNCKNKMGVTPLMEAAEIGLIEIGEILIKNGADVNAKNLSLSNALFFAARSGSRQFCKLLVDNGIDYMAANEYGSTALHASAKSNSLKTTEYLVKIGLNPKFCSLNGRKAADVAMDSQISEFLYSKTIE